MTTEEHELALSVLLRRPGIEFIRGVDRLLEREPGYLRSNQEAITFCVRELLDSADIFWDEEAIQENALNLVSEAVKRMHAVGKEKVTG